MIQIIKKDCCGCNACVQRCPKRCITMRADNEGFLYPIVDTTICIDCGICEKVCPVINKTEPKQPLKVYAAYNKNEDVRMQSSSGGIFTLLAEKTINKGGVVFGVKFNKDWMPEFGYAETIEEIAPFRGSKYVQAIVGNAYIKAEEFLKSGKHVLFSGTPCQIAGLKHFLRKDYDNLLTVDIICHGVPSPKVWKKYLEETYHKLLKTKQTYKTFTTCSSSLEEISCIETINFRSKVTGWSKYSFLLKINCTKNSTDECIIYSQTLHQNTFLRGFIADLYLRPACHNCPCKQGKSHSDITLADFWKIENINKDIDSKNGITAVLINSLKGKDIFQLRDCEHIESKYEDVVKYNSARIKSSIMHKDREKFFKKIDKTKSIISLIDYYTKIRLTHRILNKFKRIFKLQRVD